MADSLNCGKAITDKAYRVSLDLQYGCDRAFTFFPIPLTFSNFCTHTSGNTDVMDIVAGLNWKGG
jgi:hypothetical protein